MLAIGDPFGVGQTVTHGIVSAVARTQAGISNFGFFIQTDAAINPGNSGGGLIDMKGRLIGINSAIFTQTGNSVGIGFAIPVNMVKIVITAAKTGQKVRRPWFGASLQTVSREIANSLASTGPPALLSPTSSATGRPPKPASSRAISSPPSTARASMIRRASAIASRRSRSAEPHPSP